MTTPPPQLPADSEGLGTVYPDDTAEWVSHRDQGWVTIGEAAARLDLSEKTIRRRIKSDELKATLVHDPEIGGERWLVAPSEVPATSPQMIPVEVLDRLQAAYREVVEATARAEVAERVTEFEAERRRAAEAERDELRARLDRRWWRR